MDSDILNPIEGTNISGLDIRHTPEFDALKENRREDDKSISYDVWARPLKIPNWDELRVKAEELLVTKTKDLQILIWFTETFKRDFDGVLAGLQLVNQFIQKFFVSFYPQDTITRVSLLEWMERTYTDRILIIPFGLSDTLTLDQWRYSLFMKENQIEVLRKKLLLTPTSDIEKTKSTMEEALKNVKEIKEFLESHMPEAPTFHDLIDGLSQIIGILDYRLEQTPLKEEVVSTDQITIPLDMTTPAPPLSLDVLQNLNTVYDTLIQTNQENVAEVIKLAITMLQRQQKASAAG